ncbi:MAG TPA: cupredoxin domain-containing protein [Myxococcota bacterium]|nr:cupredoxin domain-containing protein [Myxococcota bacterium]
MVLRTLAVILALGLQGCVWFGTVDSEQTASAPGGFEDDRTVVQVVTTNVGGKNFFVPSTIVLTAGEGRKLSLFNTTDIPHGFAIPGLGVEVIVPPGVETEIPLPPLEARHIYAINCHVHPPHRSATLVVLPAKPTP